MASQQCDARRRGCNSTLCGIPTILWTLLSNQVNALPASPQSHDVDEFQRNTINQMTFKAVADEICTLRKQTHALEVLVSGNKRKMQELETLISVYKLKIDNTFCICAPPPSCLARLWTQRDRKVYYKTTTKSGKR